MKKYIQTSLAIAALLALTAPIANAVPTLRFTTSQGTVVLDDNAAGDLDPTVGQVAYTGGVGSWYLTATLGESAPYIGSAGQPNMVLTSLTVQSDINAGPLSIEFANGLFTGTEQFWTEISGTTTGVPVKYSTYYGNAPFDNAVALTEQTFNTAVFSGSSLGAAAVINPYYLGQKVEIGSARSAQTVTFQAKIQNVPEGGATVLMLGSGLLGLVGLAGLRRRSV